MVLQYIPIEEHNIDILIKELSRCKFEFQYRFRIGVVENPFLAKRGCLKNIARKAQFDFSLSQIE